mmetsp:Transcript_30750/g.92121  ORF Transcript_30750/g.92121 Transcript_30750/m.92121 type:complete len:86 (-) Transcript_30750:423-680(-)
MLKDQPTRLKVSHTHIKQKPTNGTHSKRRMVQIAVLAASKVSGAAGQLAPCPDPKIVSRLANLSQTISPISSGPFSLGGFADLRK